MSVLPKIQSELKAPKSQYNSFGKFSYRSCEDILEAVKPILTKYDCYLTLKDELKSIGDRYYICAVATLVEPDGSSVSTSAYAREDETKKGMDGAQITGTASSYARKYALNGLFCIDDTKDNDTNECKQIEITQPTAKDVANIAKEVATKVGMTKAEKDKVIKAFKKMSERWQANTLANYKIERIEDGSDKLFENLYNHFLVNGAFNER